MTEAPPLVSVLMPVFNAERWLPASLESAFAQTFEDFELVAVDDGSTDQSPAILEEWAACEPRLRILRVDHAGLPRAREVSLREARGQYAAFLDADDVWLPGRLERQLPFADSGTVVFSDAHLIDETGAVVGTYGAQVVAPPQVEWPASDLLNELLDRGSFIPILTALAPVRLLVEAGSFSGTERAGYGSAGGQCDYEMWVILALGGTRFFYVGERLASYRVRRDSLSADRVRNAAEGVRVLKFLESRAEGERRRAVRRARARMQTELEVAHRKLAWRLLREGERPAARRALLASLKARPQSSRAWLALALSLIAPAARRLAAMGVPDA